jgi:aryl-alcohol dehydrogenase-like predicted oxidoreductase
VPVLQDCRDQGKIRFIGITEPWNSDNQHTMLARAAQDDVWDVMMVGFNVLNQTARETVFAHTIAKNIGVLVMFAVRKALSQPERLQAVIDELIERGQLNPDDFDRDDPLGFLLTDTDATSLPDAAYRFCLREPGAHVILSGTGNPAHMQQNIESMTRPPLPDDVVARLKTMFARVDSTSGE